MIWEEEIIHTRTHTHRNLRQEQGQWLEWCSHKPRNAYSHQRLVKASYRLPPSPPE